MKLCLLQRQGALLAPSAAPRRRASAPPPRAANSAAMDLLANSTRLHILEHADQELQDLCSSKPTPESRAACMEVWKFYHDRRTEAQSGCMRELEVEGREGESCQSLDQLERLVYEVAYSGDAEQLYNLLRVQSNLAKRAKAGAASPAAAAPTDREAVLAALKDKALGLFAQMDADGNGVIDREEFLGAMQLLHHALGDAEMALALSCMDSHGYITPDQFVAIVQAEELCDPASDAEVLRHVEHARPSWWSEAPHCITDV